ncbi:hypothetical protein [Bradyrhizobium cosmicum]|uniref:Uncharacterized protein n=1 Tax=Bradyrhizobium cosmicum TaxID=1404864 RepID=A0AAI8MDM4_9BRAD|nr:hypothetical protein [Bradyrhizobium cosmicum]BAL76023.1 hypothetical protein S23_28110 [Bradyrhizobium cosmicum]
MYPRAETFRLSDVEYRITEEGKKARQIKVADYLQFPGSDMFHHVSAVRGDSVSLIDRDGKTSQAFASDIDNCWIEP